MKTKSLGMRCLSFSFFIFLLLTSHSFVSAKMFERKARVLFSDNEPNLRESWLRGNISEEEAIKNLVRILLRSKTGKELLYQAQKRAKEQGDSLLDIIKVGEGSLTDTTLVRKFSPSDPNQITYKTKTKVFVNRDLNTMDAVLDLAHELTHFTHREPFNPYRQNFKLQEFIHSTVEGKGGEVDAYMKECEVKQELFPNVKNSSSNCSKVIDDQTGELSKFLGAKQFYKVGRFASSFKGELSVYGVRASEFPHLSEEEGGFISSAYGKPYPVAAMEEYLSIMGKACENDYRRLSALRERGSRSIASEAEDVIQERRSALVRLQNNFSLRCSSFLPE